MERLGCGTIRSVKLQKNVGRQNQPGPDEQQPDDMHEKIRSWVNHRGLQCKQDVGRYISDANAELNDIEDSEGLKKLQNRVTQIRNRVETEIKGRLEYDRNDLYALHKAVKEETKAFEEFRKASGLTRMAVYPTNFLQKWWWVIFCAVLEVIVNAFTLGDVIPTGILGASALMLTITAINILIGVLVIGNLWRERNHVLAWRKILGWMLILIFSVGIVGFNLAVGHLRDGMLMIDPTNLINPLDALRNDAWQRLMSDPIQYESFQSGLLVLAGLVFFGIASWKGYVSDDAYPGYGKNDRNLRKLINQFRIKLEEARRVIEIQHKKDVDELQDILYELDVKKAQWRNTMDRIIRVRQEYPANLRQYEADLKFLLAAYRTANRNIRTEPVPGFFDSLLPLDPDIMEPPIFEPREESNQGDIAEHIHKSIENVQMLYRNALLNYPSLEDISARGFNLTEEA